MATATPVRIEPTHALPPSRIGSNWGSRTFAILMIVVGLAFITTTFAANLFKVGPAFDRLTDGFRPVMTQQSIQANRADVAQLSAAGNEIQTKVFPALAQQLNMTTTQMQQLMGAQFPAVAAGLQAIPQVTPTFNGLLTTLDQQRPLFASADAIPTDNLPAKTVPWSLFVVGVIVAGVGVFAWMSPRPGAVIAAVLGVVLIVVPLSLSLTYKASDADQLNSNLKPVYTQQLITQANGALTTLGAMGTQLQTQMLPALAAQMHMTGPQVQQFIAQNYPATGQALANMPAAMTRFHTLIGAFQGHLSDYRTLKPVDFLPVVWLLIGGGIALTLTGATSAVLNRRRPS